LEDNSDLAESRSTVPTRSFLEEQLQDGKQWIIAICESLVGQLYQK